MSPIHVQAKLNDQHLEVLGPKSPPRRRYAEVGLEGTDESDYVSTSLGTTLSRQSTTIGSARRNDRRQGRPTEHEDQLQGGPRAMEPFGTDLPPTDPTIRLLLQKVNRIEEERNQTRTPAWGKVQLGPFTSRIRFYRPEKEVQALRISFYSGVEDPVTHIHTFQSALGCKGLTDEGQCQLFPSTLAGAALNWFYRLEPGTTDRLYSADDLYPIRQGDSEPLREYAARFSHEYSRCPETDDRAAFGAFKSGLRASQFRYLVHSSNWTTYGELMKQAAIYAKAEHFNSKGMPSASSPSATTGQPLAPTVQTPYRTAPPIPVSYAYGDKRRDSFQGRQDGTKRSKESGSRNFRSTKSDRPPEVFTILNTSYERVLMAENQMIPKPSFRKLPRQVDKDTGPSVHQELHTRSCKIRRLGWEPITFFEEEEKGIISPHSDPMIIRADISDFDVGRILIDTGSSVNVLFADAFNGLGIGHQSLNKEITPLLSFSGDVVEPIGSIQLPLVIGSGQRRAFIYTHFLVVSCPTAYNAIIGRPALTRMKAILSPHMLLLKFPTQSGIGQVRGDQLSARVCYVSSTTKAANQTPRQGTPETLAVTHPNLSNATPQAQPAEELETISLSDVQDRQVRIGTSLSPSLRSEFISFLRANSEVFAWFYDDMPGISPDVISHKLSIYPSFKPVRQKRRSYDSERYEAMKAEVDKLQTIGFIREVTYPIWLDNSVLVKKSSGAWRMCQDYTNLNKACP
ncbi:unnamed protein product [Prunus brigantina]